MTTPTYHEGYTRWRYPSGGNPNDPRTVVAVEMCPFGHIVTTYHGPWAGSVAEARAGRSRIVRCEGTVR